MIDHLHKILKDHAIQCLNLVPVRSADADVPVLKVTFAGSQWATWRAIKAIAPLTGFYPVDLDEAQQLYLIEETLKPVQHKLSGLEEVTFPDLLGAYLIGVNADLLGTLGAHELELDCQPMFVLGTDRQGPATAEGNGVKEIFLIPAVSSWEALALCRTEGRLDVGPEQIAWARRWAEIYGAALYTVQGDAQDYYVERPPSTAYEALALANELLHSGFGSDSMSQDFISPQAYAAHLIGNHWWNFWWD